MSSQLPLPARFHTPDNRLQEKLARPGGMNRDEALAAAASRLDALRASVEEDIASKIARLRRIGESLTLNALSGETLEQLFDDLNEILNLAGSYQLWNLVTATAFLYEILHSPAGRSHLTAEALLTFAQAMQLLAAPGNPRNTDGLILIEDLRRLFRHVAPGARTPLVAIAP